MSNIIVTSDLNSIMVDFGIYSALPDINTEKAIYPRRMIAQLSKPYQGDYIMIIMGMVGSHEEWHLSYEEVPGKPQILIIDSINGVVPTSLEELLTLLGALIIG
jgi:hypothetical protein